MKKIGKLTAVVLAACAVFTVFTGCSAKKFSGEKVEPQKWADSIRSGAKFTDQLTELGTAASLKRYSAAQGDVEGCAVYVGTGATAEEFSVWKMKTDAAAETLEQNARKLLDAQKNSYADYRPAEVPKLQNAVLERQENVVVVCVSADDAGAKSLVGNLFDGR